MQYNTKSKKEIINIFRDNASTWLSVDDVIAKIGENAKKSTIYRQIGDMVKNGVLTKKHAQDKNNFLYKFNEKRCHDHLHLMCVDCGCYIHLEDEETEKAILEVCEKKKFILNKGKTIFYGICEKCAK